LKVLFYDCYSGISGDMNIGAMIDIGLDPNALLANLSCLDIGAEHEINIRKERRRGITGTRFEVRMKESDLPHRNLGDIEDMIRGAGLSDFIEAHSLNMFRRVAEAESKVHSLPLDEVHFHEVGATDAIIDIVGAAICMEMIGADMILSSTIELGGGFVDCAHGRLPVPAPATCEILKGMPVRRGTVEYEATTPTGAVVLAEFVDEFTDNISLQVEGIGYGVGKRDNKIPNLLRIITAEMDPRDMDTAILLECNIDDMNPELYDNVMEELYEHGASDVFFTPIIMKKSRPATKLSVLVRPELEQKITKVLFTETTTLGIRRQNINKHALYRDETVIKTKYGTVRLKHAYLHGKRIKTKPEYEDCKLLARANNVTIGEIYNEINRSLGDEI